jgi:hypothetical protein
LAKSKIVVGLRSSAKRTANSEKPEAKGRANSEKRKAKSVFLLYCASESLDWHGLCLLDRKAWPGPRKPHSDERRMSVR